MFFHHCRVGGRIVSLDNTRPDWWTNPNLVPSELQIHRFLPSIIHQTHVLSNYTSRNVLDFFSVNISQMCPPNKKRHHSMSFPRLKAFQRPTFSPGHRQRPEIAWYLCPKSYSAPTKRVLLDPRKHPRRHSTWEKPGGIKVVCSSIGSSFIAPAFKHGKALFVCIAHKWLINCKHSRYHQDPKGWFIDSIVLLHTSRNQTSTSFEWYCFPRSVTDFFP